VGDPATGLTQPENNVAQTGHHDDD
jgi:hypothetical protein